MKNRKRYIGPPELYRISLEQAVSNVKHIRALGIARIYLDGPDYPWEHVVDIHVLDRPSLRTSPHFRFSADHPCELRFEWTANLCDRDTKNSEHGLVECWQIDQELIDAMNTRLPQEFRTEVRDFRLALAAAAENDVRRYQRSYAEELSLVDRLRNL